MDSWDGCGLFSGLGRRSNRGQGDVSMLVGQVCMASSGVDRLRLQRWYCEGFDSCRVSLGYLGVVRSFGAACSGTGIATR